MATRKKATKRAPAKTEVSFIEDPRNQYKIGRSVNFPLGLLEDAKIHGRALGMNFSAIVVAALRKEVYGGND